MAMSRLCLGCRPTVACASVAIFAKPRQAEAIGWGTVQHQGPLQMVVVVPVLVAAAVLGGGLLFESRHRLRAWDSRHELLLRFRAGPGPRLGFTRSSGRVVKTKEKDLRVTVIDAVSSIAIVSLCDWLWQLGPRG